MSEMKGSAEAKPLKRLPLRMHHLETAFCAFARVQHGDDVPAARVRAHEVLWLVDSEALGTA